MKIYTKTGDDGTTAFFGGDRVMKTHPRIAAYGTVDETNAAVGMARTLLSGQPGFDRLDLLLQQVQNDLFVAGGDLASPGNPTYPVPRIEAAHVEELEGAIDAFDADLPPLKHFILPGGTPQAAALHVARTVCRRAERLTVDALGETTHESLVTRYLNRLSDLLFVLARWANHVADVPDTTWVPVARGERQEHKGT